MPLDIKGVRQLKYLGRLQRNRSLKKLKRSKAGNVRIT
jgi:hypothetical protein